MKAMRWCLFAVLVISLLLTLSERVLADADDGEHGRRLLMRTEESEEDDGLPKEDYFLTTNSREDGVPSASASELLVPSPEERLYRYLFGRGYLKNVRPARDPGKAVVVQVGMCVMMIEDLIEREQLMVMASCIKMLWKDHRLTWDPEKYDNLTWVAVSNQQVWFPDIVIVNSPDPAALTRKITNVGLSFQGELGYFPSGRLFTRCNLIITYFPFDWQHCEVRFESWIYPIQFMELDLYPGDTVDVKEHYANYQWNIKGHRIQSEIVVYDGQNFSSITITFIFRRKSLYFSMYFIFPELLLAVLQTLSHTLPVEHPGRMTMLTALFIGTSVTHAGVAAHIPKSSDTLSLLQVYMTFMSVNLVFSLLVTFLMLYSVLRYPNTPPSFKSMICAFVSIVWPAMKPPPAAVKTSKIGDLPENALSHYLRQFTHFPSGTDSLLCPQHQKHGACLGSGVPSNTPGTPNSIRGIAQLNGIDHKPGECLVGVRLGNVPSSEFDLANNMKSPPLVSPHTAHPSHLTTLYVPGSSVFTRSPSAGFRGGAGYGGFDDCGVTTQYMSKQRCITVASTHHRTESPVSVPNTLSLATNLNGNVHQQTTHFNRGALQPMTSGGDSSLDENPDSKDSEFQSETTPMRRRRMSSIVSRSAYCSTERPFTPKKGSVEFNLGGQIVHPSGFQNNNPMRNSTDRSPSNPNHHHSRSKEEKEQERKQQQEQESAENEAVDIKRSWLIYCVALDKSIMYLTGAFNIVIPIILFVLVPVVNEVFFMSQSQYQEYLG